MLLLFITIITLSAAASKEKATASSSNNFNIDKNSPTCETPSCAEAASFILKNMDSSVEPCENFYKFSCGKFVEEMVIPDNEIKVDFFSMVGNKVQEQLSRSIPKKIEDDDHPLLKLIKSYYQTCMDIDQINKNGEKELKEILKNLGGCPVLEGKAWNDSNFDWKTSVYQANKLGYDPNMFVTTEVSADPNNSSKRIITIDPPMLQVPQDLSWNPGMVETFLDIMTETVKFFGIKKKQAKKELNESLYFEIDLLKISISSEVLGDKSQLLNRMTFDQLETNYPFIPWTEYVNKILAPYAQVNRNEEAVVADPTFLKELSELIVKTPKRVLANHACMHVIMQSASHMGRNMPSLETGATGASQQPRAKKCVRNVIDDLFPAVDWLYARDYFDINAKTRATDLSNNVRDSLRHMIEQAKWMDEATKLAALEKLEAMVSYVGYPDELGNVKMFNDLYEKAVIDSGSFLKSKLNIKRLKKKLEYSSLRKSMNHMQWVDHSKITSAIARYHPRSNSFDVPAGILQGNFYNKDRPNYLNYGAIGSIIGHEMSYAFNDEGGHYDKNGNLIDWWKDQTKEEFLKKTNCIIEQYDRYTVEEADMNINGTITRRGNIADNVGLKAAYLAYDKWSQKNAEEPRLPGLNYTPKQMFWISFASNYCAKYQTLVLQFLIPTEQHAVEEFRVIGSVSNMPKFYEDFKCPVGSPMNPDNKCEFW